MKAPANCRLIGCWRILEADIWDRDYLDLCGPATLTITTQGAEIAFGALEADLETEYARDSIGFRWAGCDEVEGEGTAELLDDGTIEFEFTYNNSDGPPQSEANGFKCPVLRFRTISALFCRGLEGFQAEAFYGGENVIGGFCPPKGLWAPYR